MDNQKEAEHIDRTEYKKAEQLLQAYRLECAKIWRRIMSLPILADYLANADYKTLQQHIIGKLFYGAKTPKDAKGQVMRPATTADKSILSNYIFATPNGTVLFNYLDQDYIIDLLDKHNTPYFRYLEACCNVLVTNNKVMVDCKTVDKYKTLATPKKIMKHCRAAVTDNKLTTIKAMLQEITNDTKADTTDKIKAIDILCEQLDAMITHCLAEWRQYADYVVFAGFNDGHRDNDKTQYIMHIGLCTIGITREQAEVVENQGNVPYLNYTVPQLLKQLLLEQKEILQPTEPAKLPKSLLACYEKDINKFQRGYILPGSNDILTNILDSNNWEYNEKGDASKMIQATIPNSIVNNFKLTGAEQNLFRYILAKFTMTGAGPLARCDLSHKDRQKLPITTEDKTVIFDMLEYGRFSGLLQLTGNKNNDYKATSLFKDKMRIMLDNLFKPTYKIPIRGGKYIELGHILENVIYPEKGATETDVTIIFGTSVATQILNYGGKFDLPLLLLQTSDKYTSYIGPALYDRWTIEKKNNKLASDGTTILGVDSLIIYPVFTAVSKDRTTTQRPSRQYIEPLENALDKLVKSGLLKGNWQYCNAKGKPLTDEQLKDGTFMEFNNWRQLYIKYSIADIT